MSPRPGVWLACAAALAVCSAQKPRVLGGHDDIDGIFPFAVTLERKTKPLNNIRACTGSLITQTWVLTAAHCCTDVKVIRIRYGDFTKLPNETNKFSKIVSKVPHPSHHSDFVYPMVDFKRNDIGLISVEPVPTQAVARLGAIDYRTLFGHSGHLAGFSPIKGQTSFGEFQFGSILKPLQVLDVVMTRCSHSSFEICVQAKCGENGTMVSGDSGGPLLYDGLVVGVASTFKSGVAGTYTPVSPYMGWIQNTINSQTN